MCIGISVRLVWSRWRTGYHVHRLPSALSGCDYCATSSYFLYGSKSRESIIHSHPKSGKSMQQRSSQQMENAGSVLSCGLNETTNQRSLHGSGVSLWHDNQKQSSRTPRMSI